jgi:hypothetical protein
MFYEVYITVVLTCNIVSFKYLHRKYELQPGIEHPGLSFLAVTASAIFIKNCELMTLRAVIAQQKHRLAR